MQGFPLAITKNKTLATFKIWENYRIQRNQLHLFESLPTLLVFL